MDYETAKQLKDAGFPQEGYYGAKYQSTEPSNVIELQTNLGIFPQLNGISYQVDLAYYVKVPTLSELINACETTIQLNISDSRRILKKITGEEQGKQDWSVARAIGIFAEGSNGNDDKFIFGEGKTPEIAVANLWLEINKK